MLSTLTRGHWVPGGLSVCYCTSESLSQIRIFSGKAWQRGRVPEEVVIIPQIKDILYARANSNLKILKALPALPAINPGALVMLCRLGAAHLD